MESTCSSKRGPFVQSLIHLDDKLGLELLPYFSVVTELNQKIITKKQIYEEAVITLTIRNC